MIPCYKKTLCLLFALVLFASLLSGCQQRQMWEPGSSSVLPPLGTVVARPTTGVTIPTITTQPTEPAPPVTEPPTEPSTTEPTVPEPPVTEPPITEPPVTEQPATKPPITEPPATEPPAADEPQLQIPSDSIPAISAKNAFVYDTRTQHFVYMSGDPNTKIYPASITKLFTTYVALQYLQQDEIITIGNELYYVASDSSRAGFAIGDSLSVQNLVYAALLPSGCDACYVLANAAGRVILGDQSASPKDALSAFVSELNRQAAALGMESTHFASADGYHSPDHYISLQAFAIIGTLALENELIAKVCSTTLITFTYKNAEGKDCKASFRNTNRIINPNSSAYHSLAVGLKTGTTEYAGACLLAAYRVEDGYILVGVFGCSSNSRRFTDANALFNACLPYL